MGFGRPLLRLAGWRVAAVREFLSLDDPGRQFRFWTERLDTTRFRLGVDALLSPRLLSAFYADPYLQALPPRFGSVLRARMERLGLQRASLFSWRATAQQTLEVYQEVAERHRARTREFVHR